MQTTLKIVVPALTSKLVMHVFVSCAASLLAMALFSSTTHVAEGPIKELESTSRRLVDTQDTTTAFVFNAARAHSVGLKRAASIAADSANGGASADMHVAGNIGDLDPAK
jgi:hypothetical protein